MKYWAFLSYSHTDAKWGDWLHKALETYRVPRQLVGKESRDGKVPERLFPIFRDREELPVSADLGANINEALRESRYLIVICSPRAAQSRWVGEEITTFKKLGREDRVLALIVDGEPNASEGKAGFAAAAECFPEPLRYRWAPGHEHLRERAEPIAADVREGKDGRENAKLKLIAGLLGVNFDDLKRREHARRVRRLRAVIAVALTLVAVFALMSIYAWGQKQSADRARALAQQQERVAKTRLSDGYLDHALNLLTNGDRYQGAANLIASLRANPDNAFAADRLLFELNYGDWLLVTQSLPKETAIRQTGTGESDFRGFDALRFEKPSPEVARATQLDGGVFSSSEMFLSRDKRWAVAIYPDLEGHSPGDGGFTLFDWKRGKKIKTKGLAEIRSLYGNGHPVNSSVTGFPAFDLRRTVGWFFTPHPREPYRSGEP